MRALRVGLVGCGGIGAVHARSWREVTEATVAAACDVDRGKAEAVAGSAHADVTAMLEEVELDLLDVCTPPSEHAPAVLAGLTHGLPVLCEKPLARNAAEARTLVETAETHGLLLMTAFCHRFHPPVEFVKDLIDTGVLGRVLMFRNRFGTRFRGVEERWFSRREIAGGGALMDTAVHSVDLFRFLVGEVAQARSMRTSFHPGIREVEDSACMLVEGAAGGLGVIEASWMTPWSANVVEVYGELGAAVIDYDTGITRYRLEGDAEWRNAPPDQGPDRFVRELRHVASVLRGTEEPRVTGRDGLRAIEVIESSAA